MIKASALMRSAVAYSHTQTCSVDFYQRGQPVEGWQNAPVTGGTLTADRGTHVRLNCDISVAIEEWRDLPIDNRAGRFVVKRGIGTLGYAERLQLGEFRVEEIQRPALGRVTIKGVGLESYVTDARFIRPRTPPYGSGTIETIQDLIREAMPEAQFRVRATRDRRVTATATWDRERMHAVDALAESVNAEAYVDATGDWVIADAPDPTRGAPIFIIDDGAAGVLVDRSLTNTRGRVYNAASVAGESVDQNTPAVWAWAADLDPLSPTYYYGPFGQKPIFYTSQFFTQTSQCQAKADSLLVEALAENVIIDFATAPVDFLEVGDLVGVRLASGVLQPLLLQSFKMHLDPSGRLTCETLSSKAVIADGV